MKILDIKTAQTPPKNGDVIIQLTDIQLHTNIRVPEFAGKSMSKKIEAMEPGRAIFPIPEQETNLKNGEFNLMMNITNDPHLLEMVEKYQKEGKRVIISVPHNMPVFLGKDATQFMDSKQGRRIHRRIEKEKR
ncbi:MAG: hypothetical protein WC863_00780 [Patescibacteria group bacterium]